MSEDDAGAALADAPADPPNASGNADRMPPLAPSAAGSLHIELPAAFKVDGTESFSSWARRFEVAVQAMTPQGTDMMNMLASVLPTRLSDAAFLYWDSLPNSVKTSYNTVKDRLRHVFGLQHSLPFFQTHVNARTRKIDESLEVYSADITRLVLEAFPDYDRTAQEGEKFRRFVAGLDPALQAKIHEQGATDIDEALIVACRCERARAAMQLHVGSNQVPQTQTQVAMVQSDHSDGKLLRAVEQLTLTVNELKNDVRQLQDKNAHLTECLEYWERNKIPLVREQPRMTRGPSPTHHSSRYHSDNAHAPNRRHKDVAVLNDWHRTMQCDNDESRGGDRAKPYYSPGGAPSSQDRRYHTDDYRRPRSPSPVRQWSRDGSPQSRRSFRFRSPDSQQSFKQQPGNFH